MLPSYKKDINYIKDFISDNSFSLSKAVELSNFISLLRKYADNTDFVEALFLDGAFSQSYFKDFCLFAESSLEKTMAHDVLLGHQEDLSFRIEKAWKAHAAEAAIFKEICTDVVVLGSGAIPLTAMIYYESCNLVVHCIDYDAEALALSKAIVTKRYGDNVVSQYFKFIEGDAAAINLQSEKPSGVLLASHCEKKELILNNLQAQLNAGSRVICRFPKLLYQKIYSGVDIIKLTGYRLIDNPDWQLSESAVLLTSRVLERY